MHKWNQTWILRVLTCAAFIPLANFAAGQALTTYREKQCETGDKSFYAVRLQVDSHEVIDARTPDVTRINASPACQAAAKRQQDQWRIEDFRDWDSLSNRACSAKLGWVEYHPGECKAGGPPPICPRTDHWYKNPLQAEATWRAENEHARDERLRQLATAACDCWTEEIRNALPRIQATPSVSALTQSGTGMIVPCQDKCAIPGMACVQGVCQPQGAFGAALDSISEKGSDLVRGKAVDYLTEPLTETVEQGLSKVLGIFGTKLFLGVASGVLESTTLDPWEHGYRDSVRDVTETTDELRLEIRSLNHSSGGQAELVKARIEQLREELRPKVDKMNSLLAGLVDEQAATDRNTCYKAVSMQNSLVNLSISRLLTAPIEKPVFFGTQDK